MILIYEKEKEMVDDSWDTSIFPSPVMERLNELLQTSGATNTQNMEAVHGCGPSQDVIRHTELFLIIAATEYVSRQY